MEVSYPIKAYILSPDKGSKHREVAFEVQGLSLDGAASRAAAILRRSPMAGTRSLCIGDVIQVTDLGRWFVVDAGFQLREVSGNFAHVWMRETDSMSRLSGIRAAVAARVVPNPSGGRAVEVGAAAGSAAFD